MNISVVLFLPRLFCQGRIFYALFMFIEGQKKGVPFILLMEHLCY
jgi:hypothetical protein